MKNDTAIAPYLKGATSAASYGQEPRNVGKFDVTFGTATQRKDAVDASKRNRPKNAAGEPMFVNNKNTDQQEYKIRMLYKEMAIARSKYKGKRSIKMQARQGKVIMIIENEEKVIIRRDGDTPEPTWLINQEDLNDEEKVLALVEPPEVRRQAGAK